MTADNRTPDAMTCYTCGKPLDHMHVVNQPTPPGEQGALTAAELDRWENAIREAKKKGEDDLGGFTLEHEERILATIRQLTAALEAYQDVRDTVVRVLTQYGDGMVPYKAKWELEMALKDCQKAIAAQGSQREDSAYDQLDDNDMLGGPIDEMLPRPPARQEERE